MDHIDEMTTIAFGQEQDIQEITKMMEELTISESPFYFPRKRGRPKECFTDEEKANRQRE